MRKTLITLALAAAPLLAFVSYSWSVVLAQSVLARQHSPYGELRVIQQQDSQVLEVSGPNGRQEFRLPERVREIAKLFISPAGQRVYVAADDRLFGFDRAANRIEVNIPAGSPSISPRGDLLAYVRGYRVSSTEGGSGVWIADLESFSGRNAQPAFAAGQGKPGQTVASKPEWVEVDKLAYLFLDLPKGIAAIHVVDLAEGFANLRFYEKQLDASALVDPAGYDSQRVPAAAALREPTISKLPGPGLTVRLRFPASRALKVRRVDVQIW